MYKNENKRAIEESTEINTEQNIDLNRSKKFL